MAKRGTTKFYSNMQEKRVARELKGRVQIASGALDDKADVRSNAFLVECKSTGNDYYSLKADTWNKVYDEANKLGLCPVMNVDVNIFWDFDTRKYAIIRKRDFDFYMLSSGKQEDLVAPSPKLKIVSGIFKKQAKVCTEKNYTVYHELSSEYFSEKGSSIVILPWKHFLSIIGGEL